MPSWAALASRDPLHDRAVEQMLVGVSTRKYARSLEPVTAESRDPSGATHGKLLHEVLGAGVAARHRARLITPASVRRSDDRSIWKPAKQVLMRLVSPGGVPDNEGVMKAKQPRGEEANRLARDDMARHAARVAMARGTLVLDENVLALEPALRGKNIRVIMPPAGMPDEQIKPLILANRIIVTRNTRDFRDDASSYDYGIISLDALKFIDPEPNPATNQTVKLISKAIMDHGLWSLRHGFLVTIRESGPSTFELLTD